MKKQTEKEVAALVAQCKSALVEFSNRTGASVFSQELNKPASKIKVKPPAVSTKALDKIAKKLEVSASDMSELMVKLEVHIQSKTNDLQEWKVQRKTLEDQKEQSRQASLVAKRNAMYRHTNESPADAHITKKLDPLPLPEHESHPAEESSNNREMLYRHTQQLQEEASKAEAAAQTDKAAALEAKKIDSNAKKQETKPLTGKVSFGGGG